jgi:antitoxin VapB
MTMNIKNAETHRLARELATIMGESLTTAVTVAVQERLERVRTTRKGGIAERLMEIGRQTAPELRKLGITSQSYGDLLYDDDGPPK